MTRQLITLVSVLVVCGTVLITLTVFFPNRVPDVLRPAAPPPKTAEQIVKDNELISVQDEVRALAGIIYHSYRKDDVELLLTGLAAENTGKLLRKNFEWVFLNAAEQVPPWSTKRAYTRRLWWVESEAGKGEWATALSIAVQIKLDKWYEPYKSLYARLTDEQKKVTTFFKIGGLKQAPKEEDVTYMKKWRPRLHESPDGAFRIALPLKKPDKLPEN